MQPERPKVTLAQIRKGVKPIKKLYIWEEFLPDYCPGIAFAIAGTLREAKSMVIKDNPDAAARSDWGPVKVHPVNQKIARSRSGSM